MSLAAIMLKLLAMKLHCIQKIIVYIFYVYIWNTERYLCGIFIVSVIKWHVVWKSFIVC